MELSHFAIALKNKQLLKETNDIVLGPLQNELLSFVGGFRHLFDIVLKHHTNMTYDQHQQLFNEKIKGIFTQIILRTCAPRISKSHSFGYNKTLWN